VLITGRDVFAMLLQAMIIIEVRILRLTIAGMRKLAEWIKLPAGWWCKSVFYEDSEVCAFMDPCM